MLNHPAEHKIPGNSKLFLVIKKMPKTQNEIDYNQKDCVSINNPKVILHQYVKQIDGNYINMKDHEYTFDNAFNENEDTSEIYRYTLSPMINTNHNKGIITLFTYGRTCQEVSTTKSLQKYAFDDLFKESEKYDFYINYFYLYKDKIIFDILNNRNELDISKDQKLINNIVNQKLTTKEEAINLIENTDKISKDKKINESVGSSHKFFNIIIKKKNTNDECGKLTFVTLAFPGNIHPEIDQSFITLKNCLKIFKNKKDISKAPFRESKLTLTLRDNFINEKSKIIFIGCVLSGDVNYDYTLNTMRFCKI